MQITFLYLDFLDATSTMFTMARLMGDTIPGFVNEKGQWPRQLVTMCCDGLSIVIGSLMVRESKGAAAAAYCCTWGLLLLLHLGAYWGCWETLGDFGAGVEAVAAAVVTGAAASSMLHPTTMPPWHHGEQGCMEAGHHVMG